MTKKYDISWEYFDKLLEIFLDGFRENDHSFDDQRSDTKLLNSLLDRLVKLERWDDANYIREMLGQDPCVHPGVEGVLGSEPVRGDDLVRFLAMVMRPPLSAVPIPQPNIKLRFTDFSYSDGQDPCGASGAMGESGVPSIKITLAGMYGPIPGQQIGRLDRSKLFLGKKPYVKHIIFNEDPPKLNIDLEPLNFTDDKQDKRRNITSPGVHGEDIRIRTPKRDPGLS